MSIETIAVICAVVLLVYGVIRDNKASKRPNQPTHPRPEPWDKTFDR
jgi:hypothetical protein